MNLEFVRIFVMPTLKDTQAKLLKLRQTLPMGSDLTWELYDDHIYLHLFRLPVEHRKGQGSKWLARFLDIADQGRLVVALTADPTDKPDDPALVDLVRWYRRFGFVPLGMDNDGVAMERQPQSPRGFERLMKEAQAAKSQDWTHRTFERWMDEQQRQGCHVPEALESTLRGYKP